VRRRPIVFALSSAPIDTAHYPPLNPTPAVSRATSSASKEESRLQRVSRATRCCNRSSRPLGARTHLPGQFSVRAH
jgi:flagellar biosynthesis/type III secretory pathway ATPase